MERGHTGTDDQQPRGVVQSAVQQLWPQHTRVYYRRPGGNDPSDRAAESPDEGHDLAPAQAERDPAEVLQRQAKGFQGDHAALQGARGQSSGLSGPHVHPVPHLDRPLPVHHSDGTIHPREPGGPVQAPLLMAAVGPQGRTDKQLLPLAGPRPTRPDADPPRPGRRVHVLHAEDDNHAGGGRETAVHQPHDAVDDAPDVRVLHYPVRERAGIVLGGVEHRGHGHTGLCHRLGAPYVPGVAPTLSGARSGSCVGALVRGGGTR